VPSLFRGVLALGAIQVPWPNSSRMWAERFCDSPRMFPTCLLADIIKQLKFYTPQTHFTFGARSHQQWNAHFPPCTCAQLKCKRVKHMADCSGRAFV